jgi:hypothetical protein
MDEKRHLLEFVGGDVDGRTYDSESSDRIERDIVRTMLRLTDNGAMGGTVLGVSMVVQEKLRRGEMAEEDSKYDGDSAHAYTVVDRQEDGDVIHVRLRYSVRSKDTLRDHPRQP